MTVLIGGAIFMYDVFSLYNNPHVEYISNDSLCIKNDSLILFFNEWKALKDLRAFEDYLSNQGFTSENSGVRFSRNLSEHFSAYGFPSFSKEEINSNPTLLTSNPLYNHPGFSLTRSHKIVITPDFERILISYYPECSIEETLLANGVDPLDVGRIAINTVKRHSGIKDVPRKKIKDNAGSTDLQKLNLTHAHVHLSPNQIKSHANNPYITKDSYNNLSLISAFYNETCFLKSASICDLFEIYKIDYKCYSDDAIRKVDKKRLFWVYNPKIDPFISSDFIDKETLRMKLLENEIQNNFSRLNKIYHSSNVLVKKTICQWVAALASNKTLRLTIAEIRAQINIPKTTYHRLAYSYKLETYAEKRNKQDDIDIETIKFVMSYKGFNKGIRQIYMLMPKITDQNFSIYKIRRLMKKYDISSNIRRNRRSRQGGKALLENVKSNLLLRRFKLRRPNTTRLTDVTYLNYGNQLRAYGSASIDPVTNRLICFIISEKNDLKLVLDTLEAMDEYPAKSGAILHSDQGVLYLLDSFQDAVKNYDYYQSMSRRGNCWDNAVQESFFGHFKDECPYEKCNTLEELISVVNDYVNYYNYERGLWNYEHRTPVELEEYLNSMTDTEFEKYIEKEEQRYQINKEKAVKKIITEATLAKEKAMKELEEINNATKE